MVTEENINSNEIEETSQEVETDTNKPQETEKFDYRKARDERIARNAEKKILKALGTDTIGEAVEKIKLASELKKQQELARERGNKLSAFIEGVDKQFVDYVSYEVQNSLKDGEKFEDKLKSFVKSHPQFLGGNNGVKFSSSPNLEDSKTLKLKSNYWMNNFLRGKSKI